MSAIKLQFDQQDIAEFDRQMHRRVQIMFDTPETAIRVGTIALLKSLRASTKKAPKRRKVRVPRDKVARKVTYKGNRLFTAEGINRDTGAIRKIKIWAPDLACAKLHPKAKIVKSGLAKNSWGWAMHKLFTARSGSTDMFGQESAMSVSKFSDRHTGYAEAVIENRLDYITKALQGGRGPSVASAMGRASRSMKNTIDRAIDKATREAGY